ncbi:MAG: hypothetical protein DRJ66_07250 [Thermoprotei archaeon]|nr:MAG: hypothetical protein DRJ66_07250 [Thermoprotei archaeon]
MITKKLRDEIALIWTFDTHEHIYPYHVIVEKKPTIFEILEGSYVSWITRIPKKGDYTKLAKCLRRIRGNAFLRSCIKAIRDLHGVDISDFSELSLKEASRRIMKAYLNEDWQREVFKRARIEKCILDPYWNIWIERYDKELFVLALRINMFLFGYNREARDHNGNSPYLLAEKLNYDIETFDDYLCFIDYVLKTAKERGYICLKSALAYDRTLRFDDVSEEEARAIFGKSEKELSIADKKKFGDFIMHYILSKADELSFPIQIHTGLALIEGSNPLNLVSLFRKYPNVKFILFHGGYPWTSEIAALLLSFSNVYADLCWLPIISPTAAKRLLMELIEVTGGRRIMWGGDCWVVEGTYGALMMMKKILVDVLTYYVEKRYLTVSDAIDIASAILRTNAKEVFKI